MEDIEAILRRIDSQFRAMVSWLAADGTNGVFFLNIELEVDDSRSGSGDSELRIRIGMRTLTQIMLFL